jgi:hypothetical protein
MDQVDNNLLRQAIDHNLDAVMDLADCVLDMNHVNVFDGLRVASSISPKPITIGLCHDFQWIFVFANDLAVVNQQLNTILLFS